MVGAQFRRDATREQGESAQALFKAWVRWANRLSAGRCAMVQLNQTGYMHNRLRMVVASFLVKDLALIGAGRAVLCAATQRL